MEVYECFFIFDVFFVKGKVEVDGLVERYM